MAAAPAAPGCKDILSIENILSAAHSVRKASQVKPLKSQLSGKLNKGTQDRRQDQAVKLRKCNCSKSFCSCRLLNFNYAPLINSIAFNNYKQVRLVWGQADNFYRITVWPAKWEINPPSFRRAKDCAL